MHGVARLARVLSDETRLRVLARLMEGDATVAGLALSLGLAPARVSSHVRALRHAGLVAMASHGPERVFRADAERLSPVLDGLRALAQPRPDELAPSVHAVREIRRNSPLRQARSCYDHIAGQAGVTLLRGLLERGWITAEGRRPVYLLTLDGAQALTERGVDLGRRGTRRAFAFGCLDWTERQPHVGGALGAALLKALLERGYVRRQAGTRALHLTRPLDEWFLSPLPVTEPAPETGPHATP